MAYDWASGAVGKANFGGTDVCVTGYTFNVAGDDVDVTHSCSGGIKESKNVNDEYTGNLDAMLDLDAFPWAAPNMQRGETGTLLLYIDSTQSISIPIRVLTMNITSSTTDMIKFTITWIGTAAPTYPS